MSAVDQPASADPAFAGSDQAARAALVADVGADVVGEVAGLLVEQAGVGTWYFECLLRGYPGWRWAVVVARADGADEISVDEVVLLPGDEAILAPAWVPYRERIKPGDLSPGDILPTDEDDLRLVPAYLAGDELDADLSDDDRRGLKLVADELGLGRQRVLSVDGRAAAADRWYAGEAGPTSALSLQAHHKCGSCGFLVRLAGPLADTFGVCANEFANDDARVVSLGHGCGAHSEAQLRKKQLPMPVPEPIFDDLAPALLEDF